MKPFWFIVLYLYLLPSMVYGQKNHIQLKVKLSETHSKKPVYPGLIYIEPGDITSYLNEAGEANITLPDSAGWYIVHAHAAGYIHLEDTVRITKDTTLRLYTEHEDHLLREVNVTTDKTQKELSTGIYGSMDSDEIRALNGNNMGNLLGHINGVNTLTNGATISKPVIHGMHSNRIVTVNNGVRQEDQQWGSEHGLNIDPTSIQDITVVKGAASIRYGSDALGGVIIANPLPLSATAISKLDIGLAAFSNNRMGLLSGNYRYTSKKNSAFSFLAGGSLKKGGNYKTQDFYAANTGLEESNYHLAAGYQKLHSGVVLSFSHFGTSLGVYRGSHTGSRSDYLNAINSSIPYPAGFEYKIDRPRQHVTHDLAQLKIYQETGIGKLSLQYGYQRNYRQEYDVVRVDDGKAQLNLTLQTQTLNLNFESIRSGKWKTETGIDGIYQDNSFKDGDRLFIPVYQSYGAGIYAIEKWQSGPTELEAGLRYDLRYYDVYNRQGNNQQLVLYNYQYQAPSFIAGIKQQVSDRYQITANLASAWRVPQANELFSAGLHHGAARIELGNAALKPEKSIGINTGQEWKTRNERLSIEADLYLQYIKDYIFLNPGADMLTIRGYFKTFNYEQTNALFVGADISVHYQLIKTISIRSKASFVRARNITATDWLILIPADRINTNVSWKARQSKQLPLTIGMNGDYVFRQTRVPGNFDAIDYPRPPSDYFLLGISIASVIRVYDIPCTVNLSATNLLNTRYRDYLDAFRYFIDQQGRDVVIRLNMPLNFKQ